MISKSGCIRKTRILLQPRPKFECNHGPELEIGKGCLHVTQACEALLKSAGAGAKPQGLIVTYKDKQLPAKVILRKAYCLANKIPPETKLKFSSGEGSLQLLRSLGFQAERGGNDHTGVPR